MVLRIRASLCRFTLSDKYFLLFFRSEVPGIENELSNLSAIVFRDPIASSWCKQYQALCFACRESCSKVLFHKLFNTTVEIAEHAFTGCGKNPNTVILIPQGGIRMTTKAVFLQPV
jgi:hypothetical protein